MKKIVCLVIAFIMLSMTAFADVADDFAAAWKKMSEVTALRGSTTLTAKLNKPLGILDTIPQEEFLNIDVRQFAESFFEAESRVDFDCFISEDYKKINMSMSVVFDTPITINDDFKLAAWTRTGMWLEYDMTNADEPVYKMIIKTPFDKKYQVSDMSEVIKNNPGMISNLGKEEIKELQDRMLEILLSNADVKKEKNEYTIRLTGAGAQKYTSEIFGIIKETYPADYLENIGAAELFDGMSEFLENNSIFGENGILIKATEGADGDLSVRTEEIHICFNVFDILKAYDLSTEGLTREQADVDFTLYQKADTEKQNKSTVTMPELNDENSVVININDYDYTYPTYYNEIHEAPIFSENNIYFPMEGMARQTNQEITVETNEDEITILYANGEKAVIKGNTAELSGGTKTFDVAPVIISEGRAYCIDELLWPMSIHFASVCFDIGKNEFYVEYEKSDYDDSQYIPPTLNISFDIDRAFYIEDNVVYMPVYEFVCNLFDGEFTFGSHSLLYTASGENSFGIETISASSGDGFVTINGKRWLLEKEVRDIDGVLNIPVSFAEGLGLSGYASAVCSVPEGDISSHFWFSMENPDYEEPEDYTEDYYEDYDYVPQFLYMWVTSDQLPYIENDEVYVPLYDLLTEMFNGDFSFEENGLSYTANGKNDYNIDKVSAYVGDNFITVNGEKTELNNKVATANDIIRVPISFAEKIGMSLTYLGVTPYGETHYSFRVQNPNYKGNSESSGDLYDNWFFHIFD